MLIHTAKSSSSRANDRQKQLNAALPRHAAIKHFQQLGKTSIFTHGSSHCNTPQHSSSIKPRSSITLKLIPQSYSNNEFGSLQNILLPPPSFTIITTTIIIICTCLNGIKNIKNNKASIQQIFMGIKILVLHIIIIITVAVNLVHITQYLQVHYHQCKTHHFLFIPPVFFLTNK